MSIAQDPFGRQYKAGRLSDEETAQRMLETAVRRVDEDGLPVSFDALRLEDLIAEAGVARSAVYRRWPTKQHFYADLALELARMERRTEPIYYESTIQTVTEIVLNDISQLRMSQGRKAMVVKVVREGALQNFERLASSRSWSVYVTLLATLHSLPENEFRSELQATLARSDARLIGSMVKLYRVLLEVFGYRVRPEYEAVGIQAVGQLGAAMMDGLTVMSGATPDVGQRRVMLDPFGLGKPAEWSLPALGFASIAFTIIEPDPDQSGEWTDEKIKAKEERLRGMDFTDDPRNGLGW